MTLLLAVHVDVPLTMTPMTGDRESAVHQNTAQQSLNTAFDSPATSGRELRISDVEAESFVRRVQTRDDQQQQQQQQQQQPQPMSSWQTVVLVASSVAVLVLVAVIAVVGVCRLCRSSATGTI